MLKFLKVLILVFYIPFAVLGQSSKTKLGRLKYLTEKDTFRMGQYFLQSVIDDSLEHIVVYLINKSDNLVSFGGLNGGMSVTKEAKDKNGDWEKMQERPLTMWCATGIDFGPFFLPSMAYTWTIFDKNMIEEGEFETELRFVVSVNGESIYSKPIPARIQNYRFLPWQFQLDGKEIVKKDILSEYDKSIILKQAQVFLFYSDDYDNGVRLLIQLLEKAPNYHEAHVFLGKAYLRRLKGLSERDQYVLLSQGLQELKMVPKGSDFYNHTQKIINSYFKFLPTHAEWEKVDKSDCKKIDGKIKCSNYNGFGELVEILFRD